MMRQPLFFQALPKPLYRSRLYNKVHVALLQGLLHRFACVSLVDETEHAQVLLPLKDVEAFHGFLQRVLLSSERSSIVLSSVLAESHYGNVLIESHDDQILVPVHQVSTLYQELAHVISLMHSPMQALKKT